MQLGEQASWRPTPGTEFSGLSRAQEPGAGMVAKRQTCVPMGFDMIRRFLGGSFGFGQLGIGRPLLRSLFTLQPVGRVLFTLAARHALASRRD